MTARSGARIHIGEQSEKASRVARALSLSTLQRKWGAFQPNERGRDAAFERYRAAHKAQLARLRGDRTAAVASIRAWATTTIKALPRGGSIPVNAAVLAERDAAIRQLEEVFKAAIKRCTDARFAQAEAWRKAGSPNLPEIASPSLLLPSTTSHEAEWQAPAHLRAEPDEWRTRYFDADDRLVLTDLGNIIVVNQPGMPDAIDAALLMASQRWGRVKVRGSQAFLRRCAERGAVLGLSLVGPEGLPLTAVPTAPRCRWLSPSMRKPFRYQVRESIPLARRQSNACYLISPGWGRSRSAVPPMAVCRWNMKKIALPRSQFCEWLRCSKKIRKSRHSSSASADP
jgi:hypothetical protein